ncbi:MFS transporter [Streptomyces sp. NBC_01363]|uniref:MFS transporter n=1 Tax=Streptomyces sp. NBC_01363 TaxID=2903840 RepID=UPI00224E60FE|nr:MFS transporter [Streptomyces sp. NBC_01363]MCX4733746.1 MFS transporter [Streptomyces sp. NBC_01363]
MRNAPADTAARETVWNAPGMPALLLLTAMGFSGFAALLPTAPLWAVHGGADAAGAGSVNAILMLCTVLAQTLVPTAIRRLGWRTTLVCGMVLLGVPALPHLLTADLGVVLALAVVRGLGFGVLTVCGASAVAELVEPARRGKAVGAYGLAIAGPQFILVSTAPWAAENLGFGVVFAIGALPLLGVLPALRLARRLSGHPAGTEDPPHRDGTAGGRAAYLPLLRPMLLLLGVTTAGGALITFAPQMSSDPTATLAGLLLLTGTAAASRWRFGALADRYGTRPFLWPLVIVTAAGLALTAWAVTSPEATGLVPLLAGTALVGVSYGGLQNLTLVDAFAAVDRRSSGVASAVWNIGFDAGTGVGALLVGYLATAASFSLALMVTAALSLATLPLALARRRGAGLRHPTDRHQSIWYTIASWLM